MKEIKLTRGIVVIVDDEDYEFLNKWKWYAARAGNSVYAQRGVCINERINIIKMHRVIMSSPVDLEIDHIDGNGLNNQRSNLRTCTRSQNMMNQKPRLNCSSKYKGVTWNKRDNRYQARIIINYKNISLGYFKSEKDAAITYNSKALELYGEFAWLNEIPTNT
jgi:hypothetical protein